MAASSRFLSMEWRRAGTIRDTMSMGMAVTSKPRAPWSVVKVYSCANVTGPLVGGKGISRGAGGVGVISAPSRCRFVSESPSVGSSVAGRFRLVSSKISISEMRRRSRVPWIRPPSACCGDLPSGQCRSKDMFTCSTYLFSMLARKDMVVLVMDLIKSLFLTDIGV